MSSILYTAHNQFYVRTDNGTDEFSSEKIVNYINAVKSIGRRNEWKTSGAGARFMDSYSPEYDEDSVKLGTRINGVSMCGNEVIYSASMGEICGLYKKVMDKNIAESHVISNKDMQINKISVSGNKCAASFGNRSERHITIFDLDTGAYRELTEGDVIEDYPCYSQDGSKIFFSTAGLALSPEGITIGVGPNGIFCYEVESNEMEEVLASDSFDYIAPKEDKDRNLLFIKRPYRNAPRNSNILLDIIMFPIRIIRAIGGLLNYFSIVFGGESLRSNQPSKDVKRKQRSERDLFIDGNVINSQRILKENQRHGEKYPGIIPRSWELIRLDKNGNESCLKKGVMDYTICKNGDIVYSNGDAIISLSADGNEQLLEKCRLADNLIEIG